MTIATLRTIAANAIKDITPDYRPGITFREEHYHQPLSSQEGLLSSADTTRTFHVLTGFDPVISDTWRTGKGRPYWAQTLIIEVRYQIRSRDNGWRTLHDFAGSDAPQILQALYEADYGAADVMRIVDVEQAEPEIEQLDASEALYILRMRPRLFYTRTVAAEPTTPETFEFTTEFTTEFNA